TGPQLTQADQRRHLRQLLAEGDHLRVAGGGGVAAALRGRERPGRRRGGVKGSVAEGQADKSEGREQSLNHGLHSGVRKWGSRLGDESSVAAARARANTRAEKMATLTAPPARRYSAAGCAFGADEEARAHGSESRSAGGERRRGASGSLPVARARLGRRAS